MKIEEMRLRKRELGYTNEMIAEKSGLPLGTVQKVFSGFTKAPRRRTIEALEQVLQVTTTNMPLRPESDAWSSLPVLRDGGAQRSGAHIDPFDLYGQVGPYTISDYYAMPDDRRVELIDGFIYDMAAPSRVHQLILGQLFLQIAPCVDKHPNHMAFMAPSDVRPYGRKQTIVQPDLYIQCDYREIDPVTAERTPEFIVEILSPSNRSHDLFRKQHLYREVGVKEYWIVDPQNEKVAVYDFEHEELPESYSFDDVIPIRISEGACSVDFAPIRDRKRAFEQNVGTRFAERIKSEKKEKPGKKESGKPGTKKKEQMRKEQRRTTSTE